MKGTIELGWPVSAVVPLGVLLLVGALLHALRSTAVLGAIYLTGFLGGAIATHYRIGSPLFSHVLFGRTWPRSCGAGWCCATRSC